MPKLEAKKLFLIVSHIVYVPSLFLASFLLVSYLVYRSTCPRHVLRLVQHVLRLVQHVLRLVQHVLRLVQHVLRLVQHVLRLVQHVLRLVQHVFDAFYTSITTIAVCRTVSHYVNVISLAHRVTHRPTLLLGLTSDTGPICTIAIRR